MRPVADEYNIDPLKLAKRLTINIGIGESNLDVGRYKYMAAEGILRVEMLTRNPKKEKFLLESISKNYVKTAIEQRQRKFQDGLNFLNSQEPILQENLNNLQSEMVAFRKKMPY